VLEEISEVEVHLVRRQVEHVSFSSGKEWERGHDGGVCGRFVASAPVSELAELLDASEVLAEAPDGTLAPGGADEAGPPRFNVAPQAAVWAVTAKVDEEAGSHRRLRLYHWGLVPHWSRSPASSKAFNARAESLGEKSMFSAALARRRCIVPASAFYEWTRVAGGGGRAVRKDPWCFTSAGGELLAFAGLWEFWRDRSRGEDPAAPMLRSCTIITSASTGAVAAVHDRSPVVLPPEAWDDWLAPRPLPPADLEDLLAPAPAGLLVGFRVSRAVNDAREDDPAMIEPLPEGAEDRPARPAGGAAAQTLFEVP
jgi:putative SOS response-associated peptidase YedK